MTEYVEKETEQAKLLASLWQATPPEYVAKLPRYVGPKSTPKDQRDKEKCKECGNRHEVPAIHLDYLGHADACRILAAVDPFWQWSPKGGWTESGEPVFIRDDRGYPTALWIDLTVCGVTRPGIGTVENGKSEPEKELIGDAIRNAAMRFGVGADLWSKAKGGGLDSDEGTYARGRRAPERPPVYDDGWFQGIGWESKAAHDEWHQSRRDHIRRLKESGLMEDHGHAVMWCEDNGLDLKKAVPKGLADAFDAYLAAPVTPPPAEPAAEPEPDVVPAGSFQWGEGEEPF